MIYLISAYSVNPYNGSEDGVGWNWVLQYEKNYKEGDTIVLLTKKYNENAVRKGLKEYGIKHVQLEIVDVPKCLNWFREKYSVFHHMYYILWQHWAWLWVKKSKLEFDVIHHVTMGDYRVLGEMYKCKTAYTIFGPVGGAQVTPKALRCYEGNKFAANFRAFINWSININPIYARKLRQYDKVIASNNETYKQLSKIKKNGLMKEVELGLPEKACWNEITNEQEANIGRLLFVGRLIHKKGIGFLMDVIERLPKENLYILEIYGDGPCRTMLKNWIKKNNLEKNVILHGNKPHNEVTKSYKKSDIFLLTSLRETGGTVLLEAMSYGLPIIAFDTSFCSDLKEEKCGIFINTNQNLEKIRKEYTEAIIKLFKDKEMRDSLGKNGYYYVNKNLIWKEKFEHIYSDLDESKNIRELMKSQNEKK